MPWFFVLAGLFTLTAAVCNWDWFMNHRKARFLSNLITRTGTRIFYGVIGAALLVAGVLALTGVIHVK